MREQFLKKPMKSKKNPSNSFKKSISGKSSPIVKMKILIISMCAVILALHCCDGLGIGDIKDKTVDVFKLGAKSGTAVVKKVS